MKNLLNSILRKKEEFKPLIPIDSIVYNVDNFNLWFCDTNNGALYANKGIFLRLDKLSQSHITDYLKKSYGITEIDHQKVYYFEIDIRKDWYNRLNVTSC